MRYNFETMSDICVASHHESIAALLRDSEFLALANRVGFLVELRLDFYFDLNPASFDRTLDAFAPNLVVTYRHPEEGGKSPGVSDQGRIEYLQRAAHRGVKYVDIENRTPCPGFQKGDSKVIVSYHDFNPDAKYPSLDLPAHPAGPARFADVLKFATYDAAFARKRLLDRAPTDLPEIVIAMGEAGLWTRVLGPLFGAPLTYARGEAAPGTAPGQLTWRELDELYRFRSIKPGWPVFGVIGNPIGHSLSPLLHNTALRELNRDGVYLPFKVDGDPLQFVRDFEPLGLRGISITIPHKEARWDDLAEVDSLAKNIGAVNTLVWRGKNKWLATNTDAAAAADSLEAALKNNGQTMNGSTVVVLGAGGAARAVAFGVRARGGQIVVLNRTQERAEVLARDLGARACTHADLPALKIDAIVNTTPLGMYPKVDTSPLEKDQIPQGSIIFDTVYNPLRTKLLNIAAERGCKTLEGMSMFIGQGMRQFEMFTGATAPESAISTAVIAALKKRQAAS